jgi:Carboxypeptidase regulatory-like domain/TonB dependent receptor
MRVAGYLRGALALFAGVSLIGSIPTESFGQATAGSVIGTVLDSTGSAVPGATVDIKNTGKGISNQTTTNESGNYTQPQLTPGSYTITINKPGFKKFVQQNVTVSVGQSTRVDASLQLGEATQEVTVTSAPPGLETDRAEVQTKLSSGQISSLPVLNRNFTSLTLLTPGAVSNTYQQPASENPQQSKLVNTGGQIFAGTNYQLDGMNNNDTVLGIVMVNPALDSVAESTTATSNYDAEYHATGAVVNVETKSGSNEIHGSAFEFLQNNIFQARDPFTQGLHAPGTPAPPNRGIPELRWNQFGGSIGGPIKKDKLFFFGDYQGTQQRIGASQSLRVPTAAERTGNLSDLHTTIYDPTTGNADGSGRVPFANFTIPTNRIPTPITNLLNALPVPNIATSNPTANNYSTSTVEDYPSNQFDVRGDYYPTEKLHIFGRYSFLQTSVDAPGPFGLYGGPQFSSLGFSGLSDARNQNVSAAATYTVNPTLLTDIHFGFSRYRVTVTSPDATTELANQIGIPGLNIAGQPDTFGLPDLNIGSGSVATNGGGFSMGYSCNCPLHERETLLDFIDNWTKTVGNHTIRFGGDAELAWNQRLPSDEHRAGAYTFSPDVTSSPADAASGLGLASFLLGLPSQFNRFGQISTTQEDRQNRMFFFGQDTWRATTKLTITYGLRWDTWFPDRSLNAGQGGRYDVTSNTVFIPGVGGVSLSGNSQTQWTNFSPRLGIAYAINEKTVIRTGYGRGYSQGTFGWTFNNIAADVYPSIVNQSISPPATFQPIFPITTAPPPIVYPAIPSNGRLQLPNGISTPYIPANQKLPYVDMWNFTVEREIASQLSLSVGYVGNVGRHLNGGFALNDAPPAPGPLLQRRPLYQAYGLSQSINDKCDCTSSNYNALQVQANKRFSKSYSLLANFSWQRALDFAQETVPLPTNNYNAAQDYGPADFDREYVVTVAHTFELPFGPGRKFLSNSKGIVRTLVANWTFRGITQYNSGLPFSPTLNNNSALNSDESTRPQQIGDPFAGFNQSRNLWFNPAAYATPAPFTFGDAGRNSLRGPNFFEADWSLSKNFVFKEKCGLEFRWEVFNAFNRTNLALPTTAVDPGLSGGVIQDIGSQTPMRNMQFGAHITF